MRASRQGPPAQVLRRAISAAAAVPEVAARLPATTASLTVKISGDRELRRLNSEFLGHDEVTDVLSFAAGDVPPALRDDSGVYMGDIVISWPAALRQAAEFGHPPATEAALLAVHGFLHLLGWDHATPAEEVEMTRLTTVALEAAGLSLAPTRLSPARDHV